MTRAFRPEPEASAELEDAAVWYDSQRPGLGLEFVQSVDACLAHIVPSGRKSGSASLAYRMMSPPAGSLWTVSPITSRTSNGRA